MDFMDAVVAPVAFLIPNVVVMRADKTSVVTLGIEFVIRQIIDANNKTKSRCFGCPSFRTMEVSHIKTKLVRLESSVLSLVCLVARDVFY